MYLKHRDAQRRGDALAATGAVTFVLRRGRDGNQYDLNAT